MNLTKAQKFIVFLLRLTLGVIFFYAGVTKVINPNWSAANFLSGIKTFPTFFQALLDPAILPIVNFLNQWGLTLLGVSLLLGLFVRLSGYLGALLMLLYYLAALDFPYLDDGHAFLVDSHIVYALALILLANLGAGRNWGLDGKLTFRHR